MDDDQTLSPLELLVLALTVLSVFSVVILSFFSDDIGAEAIKILMWWDWVCSIIFTLEWMVRFWRTSNNRKVKFALNNLFDLLASLPFWLLTGQNILWLSLFRGVKVLGGITRFWSYMKNNTKVDLPKMCIALLFVFMMCISPFVILLLEQSGSGSINTADNAVWWTFCTVTTIGYGDLYPVTMAGRCFTVFVSLAGISVFGIASSLIFSKIMKFNKDIS